MVDPQKVVTKPSTNRSFSDARTNSKVGAGGHKPGTKSWKIFIVPLHFFDSTSTISRFGESFRDGQYSLVSFLFAVLLLTVLVPSHL